MAIVGNQVHNVFVYGTLLANDVVLTLLNRIPLSSSPAILNQYHRYSIKGRVYPAILPVENKKVSGKVFHGITDLELYILDAFEDVEYQRVTVVVSVMDSSDRLQAHAYVWRDKNDPDLYGEWDFEEWERTQLEDYVKMVAEFRQEVELPDSETRIEHMNNSFWRGQPPYML